MNVYRPPTRLLFAFSFLFLFALVLVFAVGASDGEVPMDDEQIMAYRWTAMARFYADNSMLNDDPDQVMAVRWTAMANFYAANDLLNWRAADYQEAADCLKFRWLALADFYRQQDLLTRPLDEG